jgi:hypothetical protein
MPFNILKCQTIAIVVFLMVGLSNLLAQNYQEELWLGYINSFTLNDKWRVWNDFHYIKNGFSVIRAGLTYNNIKNYQFTMGYADVNTPSPINKKLIRHENRLWGQVLKRTQLHPKLQYIVRFRYDARFRESLDSLYEVLENQRTFNHRFRLMQDLRFKLSPIEKPKFWHLDLINETLVNSGKSVSNGIDQVRSYLMIGYTRHNLTILSGYHQRYIPRKSQNWTLNQGLTIWVIHNIDTRKTKK